VKNEYVIKIAGISGGSSVFCPVSFPELWNCLCTNH